jgi:5-methylcytosine-specific restriction endonuclease McrA
MEKIVIVGLFCAVVAAGALSKSRGARPGWRDPRRSFSPAERSLIFARAGGRCEHRGLFFRCRNAATHADHVWPWAAGGPTVLSNAQALCQRHNLQKGARKPSRWYLARLERARRSYFPGGSTYAVSRHRDFR